MHHLAFGELPDGHRGQRELGAGRFFMGRFSRFIDDITAVSVGILDNFPLHQALERAQHDRAILDCEESL